LVQRILTPTERLLVAVSPDRDFMLWSLWAAKEAAYKAWAQGRFPAPFSPASFAVEFLTEKGHARVVKGDTSIPVRWSRGPDWVHALAGEDAASVVVRIERLEGNPSASVRRWAVASLKEAGGPAAVVRGRPPRFFEDGGELEVALSLSHDGPYGAVAFRWSTT